MSDRLPGQGVLSDELFRLLDPELVEAGKFVADRLRERRVHYGVVVGIGDASWKLALATAHAAGAWRFPMRWSHGFIEDYDRIRLDPPIERGRALLVSDGPLPDDQLTQAVSRIRECNGTISDMALIADEIGSVATARTLGVTMHHFQMGESGLSVPR